MRKSPQAIYPSSGVGPRISQSSTFPHKDKAKPPTSRPGCRRFAGCRWLKRTSVSRCRGSHIIALATLIAERSIRCGAVVLRRVRGRSLLLSNLFNLETRVQVLAQVGNGIALVYHVRKRGVHSCDGVANISGNHLVSGRLGSGPAAAIGAGISKPRGDLKAGGYQFTKQIGRDRSSTRPVLRRAHRNVRGAYHWNHGLPVKVMMKRVRRPIH